LSGRRSRNAKKQRHRGLRIAYRVLVVISFVIVLVFCIANLVVRPPAQKEPVLAEGPVSTPNPGDEPTPTPTPLVRKEYFYTFMLAARDQSSGNADSIMVVSFDVKDHRVGVVSVPRDTLVGGTYTKINSYYHGGAERLQEKVSDLLGIPIDYYITVDVEAFRALVDAVGGVNFYIPCDMDYDDPVQDLSIHFTEGTRYLNGADALKVVRFRKNNDGSGYSDTGRAETQQKLLTAVAKKVLSWSGMTKYNEFIDLFARYVKTDLSGTDMAYFAGQAIYVDTASGLTTATLPGDGSVTYRGVQWCYELCPEETLEVINRLLNPYTTEVTAEMVNILQAD